ncbi:hypothetical protein D3C81_1619460 [compost metagenome]
MNHPGQRGHAGEGGNQDEHLGVADLQEALADRQAEGAVEQGRHALLARALADLHIVLQDQRDADGADQGRQARGVAQRLVGDALDHPAVQAGDADGEQQGGEDQQRKGFQAEEAQQRQADGRQVGADHVHLAVGEIDHADDAVDHGVADGDQPVDRAEGQAVDQLLQEDAVHASGLVGGEHRRWKTAVRVFHPTDWRRRRLPAVPHGNWWYLPWSSHW